MKTKNMFWAMLSMTAALVMTACSSDNDITETPAAPQAQKTIPYTVTVTDDATTTRATVKDDPTDRKLYFAAGDKLYITGTNIQGVLDLQAGDEGKASGATFSGDLTYSGEGSPAANLELTATLVSAQQTDGEEVTINPTTKAVTVNYPTTAYCADVATAVQKYSRLTGTCEYSQKAFSLTQQTAFLNFVITFEDGTATGTALSAVVNNNSSNICTANVTTVTDNGVKAKFVLPVAAGTTLSSANVKMGDKAALTISDATLAGKVYNVNRTQAAPACSYTAPTLVGSTLTYNGSAQALVTGGSATNATIYYSTNGGSSWSTSVPTGTNAGNYTVYYKVEPADGYSGGVASTSLGTKTINKANRSGSVTVTKSSRYYTATYNGTGTITKWQDSMTGSTWTDAPNNYTENPYSSLNPYFRVTIAADTNYNETKFIGHY